MKCEICEKDLKSYEIKNPGQLKIVKQKIKNTNLQK